MGLFEPNSQQLSGSKISMDGENAPENGKGGDARRVIGNPLVVNEGGGRKQREEIPGIRSKVK